jgi:hypothetical protein
MRLPSVTRKQETETGVVFALMSVIAGQFTDLQFFYILTCVLLVVALVIPVLLKPLASLWFGFSTVLGWLSSRILLGLVFFLVVLPVAMVRKAMGIDRLRLRDFKKGSVSSWENRNHQYISDDLFHSF